MRGEDISKMFDWNAWRVIAAIIAATGIFVVWAAFFTIESAIPAEGTIKPFEDKSVVSHVEGGVLKAIHVKTGQIVKAGEKLVTIENLSFNEKKLADKNTMALVLILRKAKNVKTGEIIELITTFLPAPGIDILKSKGYSVWTVKEKEGLIKSYFLKNTE